MMLIFENNSRIYITESTESTESEDALRRLLKKQPAPFQKPCKDRAMESAPSVVKKFQSPFQV
jgi:hypothetical protein